MFKNTWKYFHNIKKKFTQDLCLNKKSKHLPFNLIYVAYIIFFIQYYINFTFSRVKTHSLHFYLNLFQKEWVSYMNNF